MNWAIFLDDTRDLHQINFSRHYPQFDQIGVNLFICRSAEEAIKLIKERGCPNFITFDNDLGEGRMTGYQLAHWLVDSDVEDVVEIPRDFAFNVHSANIVDAPKIQSLLDNYLEFSRFYSDAVQG